MDTGTEEKMNLKDIDVNEELEFICNVTHKCEHAKECIHAKPHHGAGAGCNEMIGGTWAICCKSNLLSHCVPVIDGKYKAHEIAWCKCSECGNRHRHDIVSDVEISRIHSEIMKEAK